MKCSCLPELTCTQHDRRGMLVSTVNAIINAIICQFCGKSMKDCTETHYVVKQLENCTQLEQ